MVYDVSRDRTVLFTADVPSAPVWEWDGSQWTSIQPEGDQLPATSIDSYGLVYDRARQAVLLFGQFSEQTGPENPPSSIWQWRPDLPRWVPVESNGRYGEDFIEVAYDESRGASVWYQSTDRDQHGTAQPVSRTFELLNTAWTLLPGDQPPARRLPSIAFDATRSSLVLFGGSGPLGASPYNADTWTLESGGWAQFATASAPVARELANMTSAGCRGTVLFSGIESTDNLLVDTWIWADGQWSEARVPHRPLPRLRAGIAYDEKRDQVLVFGGHNQPVNLDDFWTLAPTR
jgi:hypothetical protein